MLDFFTKYELIEKDYNLGEEPKIASLFTTGNGYMGVRGSLEEFGSTRIQGAFIRGFIDEIIEVMEPFCDNTYMKKYYINEEKLKDFEKQVSCINLVDFLLIRFQIGGKTFYPWEGEILSWERSLNTKEAILTRNVSWKDTEGNITDFTFERFASYDDEHLYCMKAIARPRNHSLPVSIISGIDTKVRTGGQKVLQFEDEVIENEKIIYTFNSGKKYGFQCNVYVGSKFYQDGKEVKGIGEKNGHLLYQKAEMTGGYREYSVEKNIYLVTSRDEYVKEKDIAYRIVELGRYEENKERHIESWTNIFKYFDVTIEGDDKKDAELRFANYHTLISASLNDSVHSLSAKGLTGEKYNQFVWWDCEIYQLPIFYHTYPQIARNALIYRYDRLEEARENALAEGCKGARFPFVSSVEGKEHVWKYVRHPFMQIHITADVGYGVIRYFENTNDIDFLKSYGLEMLYEISRYWVSKVVKKDGKFQLLQVTGTDEHHPYVDNDAYTNYIVQYVLSKTIELDAQYSESFIRDKVGLDNEEIMEFKAVSEGIYLPLDDTGLIPQFDGYFSLSRDLKIEGIGTGKNFQMKQSGLYHESQIIKQPDVMLLYSYLDIELEEDTFEQNWDYYEHMCESSSSLTYPVHAICSAKANRMLSFYRYFDDTLNIDIKDIHGVAWQGMHAGCLAGGWFAIFKGLMGIRTDSKGIKIEPKLFPFWKSVELNFVYHTKRINAKLEGRKFILSSKDKKEVIVTFNNTEYIFDEVLEVELE